MKRNTTHYAYGTSITQSYPFGIYVSAYALCPDGRVRKVKRIAQTADSFFSIPASIKYKGKTVAGHLYFSRQNQLLSTVMFAPYSYRKHGKIFNSTECNMEVTRFDIVEAWYLALSHCHGGQWSDSYARLCKLQRYFRPSPSLRTSSLTEVGKMIYDKACNKILYNELAPFYKEI